MEALLIDEWLRDTEAIFILDEASLTVARERVRAFGAEAGVAPLVVDRASLVVTELGRNQLRHARAGRIAVRSATRGEHRGIEIVAADRGAGIADVAGALDAAPRSSGTLGVGLGSVRRLSTEVDVDIRLGEGTRVIARVFDDEAPRGRQVGIYGRPHEEETISGDHACFACIDEAVVVGVCDGLGHGPPAREASVVAMKSFYDHIHAKPVKILETCHDALGGTRGVVMSAMRLGAHHAEVASIGNVDVMIVGPRTARRLGGSSAVLGGHRRPMLKPRDELVPIAPGELAILATDGISSKLSIEDDLMLLREHPVAIAQRIMDRFGRTNDDALVLVVR